MLGDFLYQLTPRDLQVTWVEFFFRAASLTQNAATLNLDVALVPEGRILVLQHASIMMTCPATVGAKRCHVTYEGVTDGAIFAPLAAMIDFHRTGATPTGEVFQHSWHQLGHVPQGATLRASAVFTAANIGNSISASFGGYLIPRGNAAI